MAIEPSILAEESQFELIPLHNISLLQRDFLVEVTHRLFETSIAQFLGLDEMKLQESAITCVIKKYTLGRMNCIKFITYEQMMELLANTSNPRADKFKPLLYQAILTQVMPLFNAVAKIEQPQPDKHSHKFHSDLFGDLTVLTHDDGSLWFIGKEVAEKLGYSRPSDAVAQHCKGTVKHRMPSGTGFADYSLIPERDVYRLVMRSKLPTAEKFEEFVVSEVLPSIRKTGAYGQVTAPAVPQAVELSRKDLLLLALKSEEEKELLQQNYNLLGTELSQAIREKAYIGSKREASVMGKLARANDKVRQLEAKLSKSAAEYQYATVLAIQSRLKHLKVNGLKLTYYCNRNGLVMKDIPDDRFGVVHSYPAEAWKDVYQIDINAVLNKVA